MAVSTQRDAFRYLLYDLLFIASPKQATYVVFFFTNMMKLYACWMIFAAARAGILWFVFPPPIIELLIPLTSLTTILLFVRQVMLPPILSLAWNTLALKPVFVPLMGFEFRHWKVLIAHTTLFHMCSISRFQQHVNVVAKGNLYSRRAHSLGPAYSGCSLLSHASTWRFRLHGEVIDFTPLGSPPTLG